MALRNSIHSALDGVNEGARAINALNPNSPHAWTILEAIFQLIAGTCPLPTAWTVLDEVESKIRKLHLDNVDDVTEEESRRLYHLEQWRVSALGRESAPAAGEGEVGRATFFNAVNQASTSVLGSCFLLSTTSFSPMEATGRSTAKELSRILASGPVASLLG